MFFFEKKNQKTFTYPGVPPFQAPTLKTRASIVGVAQDIKVFCFFSSEKKTLP
jgi:hypothetical protein